MKNRIIILCGTVMFLLGCENSGLNRGWRFIKRKDYVRSISSLTTYIRNTEINDENVGRVASAYFYRGFSRQMRGEFEVAIEDYRESLHLMPHFYQADFNIGLIKLHLGIFNDAISSFEQAWSSICDVRNGQHAYFSWFSDEQLREDATTCYSFYLMTLLSQRRFTDSEKIVSDLPDWITVEDEDTKMAIINIKQHSKRQAINSTEDWNTLVNISMNWIKRKMCRACLVCQ